MKLFLWFAIIFLLNIELRRVSSYCLAPSETIIAYRNSDLDDFLRNEGGDIIKISALDDKYVGIKIEETGNFDTLCTKLMNRFKHITHFQILSCGIKRIDLEAFHRINSVRFVEIIGNNIHEIPAGLFSNLRDLNTLRLGNNKISKIHENAFDNLQQLEEIDLSENEITAINTNWFKGCVNLKIIGLDENKITVIPYMAFQYLNPELLVNIAIASNEINKIEAGAFANLKKIGKLQLRRNQIEEIPNMFEDLHEAKKLGLNRNYIKCIPEVILQSLNKFREIKLVNNPISKHCILKIKFMNMNNEKYYLEKPEQEVQ